MRSAAPILRDLVLIGGGHAHAGVIASFAMHPVPGVRITLVTRDVETPYSGMLPGFIAGFYSRDECHIDLRPLCRLAGIRLIHDQATGIDLATRRVSLATRPAIPYDVLSIDIGSTPRLAHVAGASEYAIPVKPIDGLAHRWEQILADVKAGTQLRNFVAVGGGAAGVEVILAARHRLRSLLSDIGTDPGSLTITLLTASEILAGHPAPVRNWFRRHLASEHIDVHEHARVASVTANTIKTVDGTAFAYDRLLWITEAGGAPWLADTGLQLDGAGFIKVDATLRALGHANIFAAGDIAANVDHPRPKAGVFAVRQGMPLADNLRRVLAGAAPRPFRPQKRFLTLVSAGDRLAVGARGPFWAAGRLMWRWKDHIDRTWMRAYQQPDALRKAAMMAATAPGQIPAQEPMRCGGCGSKVGAPILARVMRRLTPKSSPAITLGLDAPDDAAIIAAPAGKLAVQSVDYFRAFLDDPYLMGRIAAVHALSDVYAMGGTPETVLAIAAVPNAADAIMEEELYQMLRGGLDVIEASGAVLAGGHTSEGAELALGFAVTGSIEPDAILRKSGMRSGDTLILTKPLGSGTLLAADMRAEAKGADIDAAIAIMQRSNAAAVPVLRAHAVNALTDVTGFGLAGHLHEMLVASACDATLDLAVLPAMPGALDTLARGIESTIAPQNRQLTAEIANAAAFSGSPRFALLFDPQTAGGLLASIPSERATSCISALHAAGYADACVIGTATPRTGPAPAITLRD